MEINQIEEVLKKIYENAKKIYKVNNNRLYEVNYLILGYTGESVSVNGHYSISIKDIFDDKTINEKYEKYLKEEEEWDAECKIADKKRRRQQYEQLKKEFENES